MNRLTSIFIFMALFTPVTMAAQEACYDQEPSLDSPFNRVFQVVCHNCYEPQYAPSLSGTLDYVKGIEIDFYNTKSYPFGSTAPRYWYVRHGLGIFQQGNLNNCGKHGNGDLRACLSDVRSYMDQHPEGAPIVIYTDKKQFFDSQNLSATALDQLALEVFGSKVYRPRDLKGDEASLRAAVKLNGWPTFEELQGKIILVLNGGGLFNQNLTQHGYIKERQDQAMFFVGPATDEVKDITGIPNQFDAETASWVVFHNLNIKHIALAKNIDAEGRMSRVWGGDELSIAQMKSHCVKAAAYYDFKTASRSVSGVISE